MSSGLQPLLNVPGRVNASNALRVTGDTGGTTGATNSLGALVGKATAAASDSLPSLLVVFV
jgi:hypothetical protein